MSKSMGKKVIALLAVALILLMSACSVTPPPTAAPAAGTTEPTKAEEATAAPEPASDAETPFGKYDEEVTITAARDTYQALRYIEGEDAENNAITKLYKERLNIVVKYLWIVDQSQYEAKVNVSIASGDLPDALKVSATQLNAMNESELLTDMTGIYEKYASPLMKNIVGGNEVVYKASLLGGKLMGIPSSPSMDFQIANLWIRKDWMENLGLAAPKTADDVIKIAEAFAKNDPDKNGQNDTMGLSFSKDLAPAGGFADIGTFFNMYHAYPKIWVKDTDGKLVYGSLLPEVKTVLAKLAEMYKAGIIDQEFSVKDSGKVSQDVVGEKLGMAYGHFWNPAWPFQDLRNKNNKVDWVAYPIVSADDKPALTQASMRVNTFLAVNKSCKHPEAIVKMMNLGEELFFGNNETSKWFLDNVMEDPKYAEIDVMHHYPIMHIEPPALNSELFRDVPVAVDKGNTDGLMSMYTAEEAGQIIDYLKNNNQLYWFTWKIRYAKDGGMAAARVPQDSNAFMYNEFYGIPGPMMTEKQSALTKLEQEIFTKIIMGSSPLDDFDKFVEQWEQAGGDEVTAEVNEWYAANK